MRKSRYFVFRDSIAKYFANLLQTFFWLIFKALFDLSYKAIVAELKQKAIWPYS